MIRISMIGEVDRVFLGSSFMNIDKCKGKITPEIRLSVFL